MGQWDQGSLGEMRTSTLLSMLERGIGLPVTWLPLTDYGRHNPKIVEVATERDLDLYSGMDWDEAVGTAFRASLQSVMYQVRQNSEGVSSLIVDTPDEWRWMYGQGVVGPVRVGLIRDLFNFRVRVGMRVLGLPYMLAGVSVRASETRMILPADRAHLEVEA